MAAIEFSTIPDLDADYDLLLELLANFTKQTGIAVKPTRMQWTDAWQQVINISTHRLSIAAKELLEDKDADLDTLLFSAMNSLSHRLNLILE